MGLSSRAVRVASVAVSSRLTVTTTARAVATLACCHAAVRVASAMIAVSPASLALVVAAPSGSMTTTWSTVVVLLASNVSTAWRPIVP